MKSKTLISSLLLTVSILFVSCNSDDSETVVEVSNDDDNAIVEISSNDLSGSLNSEVFIPEATLWKTSVEDGIPSYVITFFDDPEECDEDMDLADAFLIMPSENDLATGYYENQELFFYLKSSGILAGTRALVNIDEVTATTITGRVKDLSSENSGNSLEGRFVAQRCGN